MTSYVTSYATGYVLNHAFPVTYNIAYYSYYAASYVGWTNAIVLPATAYYGYKVYNTISKIIS